MVGRNVGRLVPAAVHQRTCGVGAQDASQVDVFGRQVEEVAVEYGEIGEIPDGDFAGLVFLHIHNGTAPGVRSDGRR